MLTYWLHTCSLAHVYVASNACRLVLDQLDK